MSVTTVGELAAAEAMNDTLAAKITEQRRELANVSANYMAAVLRVEEIKGEVARAHERLVAAERTISTGVLRDAIAEACRTLAAVLKPAPDIAGPTTPMCRIEVNRFDGQGWRQWGCGREMEVAVADRLIERMRPEPERRAKEAKGLAVPGKLFRKVPASTRRSIGEREAWAKMQALTEPKPQGRDAE